MTFLVVMKIFGKFAYLFVVSLLMGVAFGLIVALLLKKYNVSTYPQVSKLCTFLSSYSRVVHAQHCAIQVQKFFLACA